jgi:ferredoxin-NADP reductase
LADELYTARLERKICLSEYAQCFHFDFVLDKLECFSFAPGQFVSAVAEDDKGREQTRAYSIASAPNGNRFELCVNRVAEGFFSNKLADLPDLPVGGEIQVRGPYGYFTLREPLTDSILVATGTGIAPLRSFIQWIFPAAGPEAESDRSLGKDIWLVHGTRYEGELYYRAEFEALARLYPNFHYLPTLSRPAANWTGLRGYVQEHATRIIEERAARLGLTLPGPPPDPAIPARQLRFDFYTYICGLSNMVASVRERLNSLGWHRKQIIVEQYD